MLIQLETVRVFRRWNQERVVPRLGCHVFIIRVLVAGLCLATSLGCRVAENREAAQYTGRVVVVMRDWFTLSLRFQLFRGGHVLLKLAQHRVQGAIPLEAARWRHVRAYSVLVGVGQRAPPVCDHRRPRWWLQTRYC